MAMLFFYWLGSPNCQQALGCCVVNAEGPERRLRIAARMALRSTPLWLLVLVTLGLRESCFGVSSHSLKYFSTSISDPSQGQQPHFVAVGYVDDQIFVHYDSHSRRLQPRVSWMEKVGKEDPQYWDRETQISRGDEESFRVSMENLRSRYNQSESLHTLQRMFGCELYTDKKKKGFFRYGYEGRTFITFDKERLTWVAPDPQAQITKRKLEADPGRNERDKSYLEEICIEWLEKYLSYGKETLQRTEIPMVTVSSRTEVEDGMETHICRVDGFYPRDIDASWRRDGEVWLEETFHGSVAPNADGTYHYWLSIRIDPEERSRYRCHVEHDGLQEPLDLELKEPTNSKSNLGLIIGCVVAALVLACTIAGILGFFKKRQDDYKAAPTSDKGSISSEQGSNWSA
ncbi:major histocompatibility complex class I-related gene protein-like [Thamnophis elegans]|uniref:major histocompatibility complex class I-related gene protein-like n=1 Tax=Thamnophis elegans TaxID=35005 RepID=UPI0013779D70|nr:major histocompatibility complex class I-related gene protein-like [Thamnophis elegans]